MKYRLLLSLVAASLVACGSGTVRTKRPAADRTVEPAAYTYRIKAVYPHATDAYTQGLQFVDGLLWEGTGLNGASRLTKTDLETSRTTVIARLPRADFGEGITLLNGKIYQLTWQSNKAYVYDAATGRETATFRYTGEGWGLTTDGEKLYMSDGSENIRIVDPVDFRRTGSITVTLRGEPVRLLNELEWIDGRIWANVYTTDYLLVIDPATGIVEGIVDLTGLLPDSDRTPDTDVLNGIARDAATGRIFVTGKNWPKLFEIEIVTQ